SDWPSMKHWIAPIAALSLGASVPSLASACGGTSPAGQAPDATAATGDSGRDVSGDGETEDAQGDGPSDAGETEASNNLCAPPTRAPIAITSDITTSASWTCDNVYLVAHTVKVVAPATL